ncbi:glucan endo-1,3-beta-glucosidase 1 [Tanacetum coccineum]
MSVAMESFVRKTRTLSLSLRTAKRELKLATHEAIIILSLWADGWFSFWKNSISTCNNDIADIDGCSKAPEVKAQRDKNEPYVGVNIGTDVSNLLPPTKLVAFLQQQKVTHIYLYDADVDILKALLKTKVRVIVSVSTNQSGSSSTPKGSGEFTVDAILDKPSAIEGPGSSEKHIPVTRSGFVKIVTRSVFAAENESVVKLDDSSPVLKQGEDESKTNVTKTISSVLADDFVDVLNISYLKFSFIELSDLRITLKYYKRGVWGLALKVAAATVWCFRNKKSLGKRGERLCSRDGAWRDDAISKEDSEDDDDEWIVEKPVKEDAKTGAKISQTLDDAKQDHNKFHARIWLEEVLHVRFDEALKHILVDVMSHVFPELKHHETRIKEIIDEAKTCFNNEKVETFVDTFTKRYGYIWMVHMVPGSEKCDLAMRRRQLWEKFIEDIEH